MRLGINVDLLDGRSGLLLRRVDAGLLQRHNVARSAQHAAQSAHAARGSSGDAGSAAQQMVLPGDQVIGLVRGQGRGDTRDGVLNWVGAKAT